MDGAASAAIDFSKCEKSGGIYKTPWKDFRLLNLKNLVKIGFDYTFGVSKGSKPNNKVQLEKELPVRKLDIDSINKEVKDGVQITWLGHASVLVQMEGLTVLADPMFSERCSPVSFSGPKRYRPVPTRHGGKPYSAGEAVRWLGVKNIDVVVISHNHYDHLDIDSVKALDVEFRGIHWFVPAGVKKWLSQTIHSKTIKEFEWWDTEKVKDVLFTFVPSKHWSGRGAMDRFQTLWGSWCIGDETTSRFYFAGDTGYCGQLFKEIGSKFGGFDCAAIPIGAYHPREMMKCQHVNPPEAVQIHKDLKSKQSVGIHWGTFALAYEPSSILCHDVQRTVLTSNAFPHSPTELSHVLNSYEDRLCAFWPMGMYGDQPYMQPPSYLQDELEKNGIPAADFITMQHGETKLFPKKTEAMEASGCNMPQNGQGDVSEKVLESKSTLREELAAVRSTRPLASAALHSSYPPANSASAATKETDIDEEYEILSLTPNDDPGGTTSQSGETTQKDSGKASMNDLSLDTSTSSTAVEELNISDGGDHVNPGASVIGLNHRGDVSNTTATVESSSENEDSFSGEVPPPSEVVVPHGEQTYPPLAVDGTSDASQAVVVGQSSPTDDSFVILPTAQTAGNDNIGPVGRNSPESETKSVDLNPTDDTAALNLNLTEDTTGTDVLNGHDGNETENSATPVNLSENDFIRDKKQGDSLKDEPKPAESGQEPALVRTEIGNRSEQVTAVGDAGDHVTQGASMSIVIIGENGRGDVADPAATAESSSENEGPVHGDVKLVAPDGDEKHAELAVGGTSGASKAVVVGQSNAEDDSFVILTTAETARNDNIGPVGGNPPESETKSADLNATENDTAALNLNLTEDQQVPMF